MSFKLIAATVAFSAYASASMAALNPGLPDIEDPAKTLEDYKCQSLQVVYLPQKSEEGKPALLQCSTKASGSVTCGTLVNFWKDYSTLPTLKGESKEMRQAILDNCPEDAKILTEPESLPPPKPLTFEQD